MSRLLLLSFVSLTCLASSAVADVISVTADRSVTSYVLGQNQSMGIGPMSSNVVAGDGAVQQNYVTGYASAVNYQLSFTDNVNEIAFSNNATTMGQLTKVTALSAVTLTFRNDTGQTITPNLLSNIIPGAFGAYISDPTRNPTYDPATKMVGDVNRSPETLSGAFTSFSRGSVTSPLATANFSFMILEGTDLITNYAGGVVINSVFGATYANLSLSATGAGGAPAPGLNNFRMSSDPSSTTAIGYQWDSTDINVPLKTLAPGEEDTLTYITTVQVSSNFLNFYTDPVTGQIDSATLPQLVAYSGFGDPIGKSGSISPTSLMSAMLSIESFGSGGINSLDFAQMLLNKPSVDPVTGDLSFTFTGKSAPPLPLTLQTITPSGVTISYPDQSAAPEPQAWVLMMAGVGGMGAALRSRRRRAVAA